MAIGAFNNPIQGANGTLLINQLISANYVAGVSGWRISSDGSAEFQDVILPGGSGGITATFSATAPVNPKFGDLWYNTGDDLLLSQWDGVTWVPYQFSTNAIADGAITNGQLANSVTARSIGGINTTVAPTAPANPNTGDLWVNSTLGNVIEQWTGAAWSPIVQNAADVLQSGTVTASQIQAGTITGNLIAAGTITGSLIAAGTITAALINANAINGFTIAGVTINAGTINASDVNITSGAGNAILVYA